MWTVSPWITSWTALRPLPRFLMQFHTQHLRLGIVIYIFLAGTLFFCNHRDTPLNYSPWDFHIQLHSHQVRIVLHSIAIWALVLLAGLEVFIESNIDNTIFDASDRRNDTSTIMLPPEAFENETLNAGVVFSLFSSPDLYPLGNGSQQDFAIASNVVSATVVGVENMNVSNVTIVLKLNFPVSL